MKLNADFSQPVLLRTSLMPWVDSPMAGVQRRMLDRVGGEVARATSIVSYAPGSRFSPHVHGGGEEFIVLDGVFQDEHADYAAGSYVRNPPTTHHTPRSDAGCVIFVKLWQFDPADRVPMVRDLLTLPPGTHTLVDVPDERVALLRLNDGDSTSLDATGGAELLVLQGRVDTSGQHLNRHDWLRLPTGSTLTVTAVRGAASVWVKTRHLRHVRLAPTAG